MPLTQADADLIVRTLLNTPILDLYPATPSRNMTVGATLQWAAANAGRARDDIERLRGIVTQHTDTGSADLKEALLDALEALGPLELIPTSALQVGEPNHG